IRLPVEPRQPPEVAHAVNRRSVGQGTFGTAALAQHSASRQSGKQTHETTSRFSPSPTTYGQPPPSQKASASASGSSKPWIVTGRPRQVSLPTAISGSS